VTAELEEMMKVTNCLRLSALLTGIFRQLHLIEKQAKQASPAESLKLLKPVNEAELN